MVKTSQEAYWGDAINEVAAFSFDSMLHFDKDLAGFMVVSSYVPLGYDYEISYVEPSNLDEVAPQTCSTSQVVHINVDEAAYILNALVHAELCSSATHLELTSSSIVDCHETTFVVVNYIVVCLNY